MKHCGVFFVIENLFSALKDDFNLNLIYSSKKAQYKKEINKIDIPEVDYDERYFKSKEELLEKAKKLKDKIKSNLDLSQRCILHCHNVNLFKNSYLGAALKMLAEDLEEKDFKVIMQVHDFAEENRPKQLDLMSNCTGKEDIRFGSSIAYPTGKDIIYCTINSRDKKLLEMTGIKDIFLFPNGIDTKKLSKKSENKEQLKKDIQEYAKNNNYNFNIERKSLVYPVKTIKRKNIPEAILILKFLNNIKDEWQLLITLDAHSESDKIYSEEIKSYVRENKLPVTIGFGYNLIKDDRYSITDLFSIADSVITTSVQEGFGFTFLEAWVAEKKIIGRKIDFIFKDLENNGLRLDHFYEKITINKKDFADYNYKEQLKLLKNIDYNKLNLKDTVDFIYQENNKIKHNKEKVIENYSLEAYRKKFLNMIKNKGTKTDTETDNKELIKYFKDDKSSDI